MCSQILLPRRPWQLLGLSILISSFLLQVQAGPVPGPTFTDILAGMVCFGWTQEGFPQHPSLPKYPSTVSLSRLGWRLAWHLLDGNTEDSSADLRNVRTGLGKSAVFVVWGFEASFTTDLPRTWSSQMCSPPGGPFPCWLCADRPPGWVSEGRAKAEVRGFTHLPHPLPAFLLWGMSTSCEGGAVLGELLWFLPHPSMGEVLSTGTPYSDPGNLSQMPLEQLYP